MIRITPTVYLIFWSVLMLACLIMGGLVVHKLNVLIELLKELKK